VLEDLKAKAKKLGLWNMFLPKNHFSQGAGFSNLEYGLMAELLGKSKIASEVGVPYMFSFSQCTGDDGSLTACDYLGYE
jgi:alkylation response protein AidB-like acyl-CoA dehydrogenase